MNWIKQYFPEYRIFIWLLFIPLLLNEFTLVLLDENPPLSSSAIQKIRIFNALIISVSLILSSNLYGYLKLAFSKIKTIVVLALFYFSIIIVLDIVLGFLDFGYPRHYHEENVARYPSPYDMFAGKPNIDDHNQFGFRGNFDDSHNLLANTVTLAFFGGSTGYNGNPTIVKQMEIFFAKKGIKLVTYNFSSVSSTHSQHVHRLLKYIKKFRFDFVIFYGGGNESMQYATYDPRPGYPYNYFYRNELSAFRRLLIENSSIIGEIDRLTQLLSGLSILRKEIINSEWEEKIINRYLEDLNMAREISHHLGKPNVCSKTQFISITQPGNPLTKLEKSIWLRLTQTSKELSSDKQRLHFDLSSMGINKEVEFEDIIHISELSREEIAKKITSILFPIVLEC